MIKKYWKIALTVFFFVVIVPIIINESYKAETIYITMWEAPDVLAYYGGILGVVGAVYILARTITSTTNQIQSEHFVARENTKWNKVEEVIMEVLADIMPFNMLYSGEATDESTYIYLSRIITHLQKYALRIKTSLNIVKCYVSPVDYPKVEFLVNEIQKTILSLCEIEAALEDIYRRQRGELLKYNGIFPPEAMKAYGDEISKTMEKILPIHDGQYQQLYNIKRDVFAMIYTDIDMQAEQILKHGKKRRKNQCPHLNGLAKVK